MARTRIGLLTAFTAFVLVGSAADAQEFCVSCTGPNASYRCLIGGEVHPATRASRGQFLCITELARSGGHTSCSATRAQATPCPGETRTVMFPAGEPDGAVPEHAGPVQQPAPPPAGNATSPEPMRPVNADDMTGVDDSAATPEPAPSNPVADLAKKTGDAVKDTGEAVGGAVKKTWDCVTSMFGDC